MVTLRSKSKSIRVYNLDCAIPQMGAKAQRQSSGCDKVDTERVLTLQPGEKRCNLPLCILDSLSIKNAIAANEIKVLKVSEHGNKSGSQAPTVANKHPTGTKGAKSFAASEPKEQ